jgi:predicted TIM-barrel fold metal-dependent hydrolase
MIFDFRVFLGHSFDGTQQTVSDLLRTMDSLNIEMALACPLKPLSYNLDLANTDLANGIKDYPDRLVGAVRLDPWQPDASETMRRGVEALGLRALYLNPWEENFRADLPVLDPLLGLAAEYGLPVVIATGYPWLSEALQVHKLARRWPRVPVVMTNGGQINISGLGQADATLALRQTPNLHLDTAGIYRQDFIEDTIEEFGGARVLFGSGAPYFDQRYEIKRVVMAKVDDTARQAVQGRTARQLLGFKSI